MLRVNKFLSDKGILTKTGTIVDATIIHAPTSTKKESKQRDPEMLPALLHGEEREVRLTELCMIASLYLKRKVLASAWG